ncbi:MAG TPA: sulfatase-like hydrolase/transferase [Thermoanaerobaculia bacterium]|jgi:arylsulfatase A-like enzyme/Tfp pilus assembly protein PilF|nr:sulfatase-like hydrolase/transferase [Thermoanaerobaculia bacterium]
MAKKKKPDARNPVPPPRAGVGPGQRPAAPSSSPRGTSRRTLLVLALAGLIAIGIAAFFLLRNRFSPSLSPARDIILITIDTTRAGALGYAGNTNVKTPFIDALAGRGIIFTNAHAHNVITLPSHVNILTGLYAYQHGVHDNAGFVLDPSHLTVATRLRQAGYTTGAFVGAFPLDSRFGLNQGFDTYDDNYGKGQASVDFVEQERRATAVLSVATRWWKEREGRKRFMWIHLYDPHAPYLPPEPFLSEYRYSEYLGEIAYVDDSLSKALGPILDADPDALVILTSDHGESLGEHGEQTHGLFAYESTLKIPLILARRGIAHRIEPAYVRHVDIVPTILTAAAIPVPKELPGQSLLGTVAPSDSYFEALSASLNRGWAPLTGVIHGGVKYVDLPLAELYDLPHDPHEANNLVDERRREVELARKLLDRMKAEITSSPRSVSPEEVARLRSLGYIAGSAPSRAHYTAGDDPKSLIGIDGKMHDAIDAFEHHDPARGLQLARELVAERPSMIAGREILAFMLEQNDLVGEAIEQLKIIVHDPAAGVDDRVQLALLYCETAQPAAAVDLLAPLTATKNPDVLNAYGVALSDQGKGPKAREQFERVLSIDANNAPALQNLGILVLRQDDVGAALTYLNRALDLNPKLPLALNTLGVAYARVSDFSRAVDAWNRAIQSDPRQYDALLNIGIVEAKAGNAADARDALERFIKVAPRSRYGADIAEAQRTLAQLH